MVVPGRLEPPQRVRVLGYYFLSTFGSRFPEFLGFYYRLGLRAYMGVML